MNKLLGIATIGNTLASIMLLHRFLSGLTDVVALAIVSAFIFCMFLAAGFCAGYFGLVHYGFTPYAAAVLVAVSIFLLATIFAVLTFIRLRQLRDLHRHDLQRDTPGLSRISSTAHAFMEGFLNPHPP